MAYLGFTTELKRQRGLAGLAKQVRNHYERDAAVASGAAEEVRQQGVKAIEQHRQQYAEQIGLPTAESSAADKARYRDYMAPYSGAVSQQMQGFAQAQHEWLGNRSGHLASAIARKYGNDASFDAAEVAQAAHEGWGTGEMHTGVMDIFNKTADARATALGITRFRGTDGAMGTLGSIGSLLYKDDSHLSDNVVMASAIGGAAVAGMAAGKAIGAGLDATLVDRD